MAEMTYNEIAGAIGGMDGATGSNNPLPPSNSNVVMKFTSVIFARTNNSESRLNGCTYCLIEGDVIESNTSELPVGSKTKIIFSGLDARMNMKDGKSSLAEGAKADLRAACAAAFGLPSTAAAPAVPPTAENPQPKQNWVSVAFFLSRSPESVATLRPVRVVSGSPNKKGTFTSRQYLAA